MAEDIARLMHDRLGARGHDLRATLTRLDRHLPRKLRREAEVVARAAEQAANPRLAPRIDMARVQAAHQACLHHLRPLGRAARVKRWALNLAAALMLVVLASAAVAIWALHRAGKL
ncbi:hypothetical protein CCR83_14220 [Rhodobacter veldkampii DSM 11550]|nr:hypothetical protein [Phaeovulum veldkampii DSM 11550]